MAATSPSGSKARPSGLSSRRTTTCRGHPPVGEVATEMSVTTILVANLHCSSCVRTIQDTLNDLSPPPESISVSVVSQFVTVHHTAELSQGAITDALDAAGFDLVSTPAEIDPPQFPTADARNRKVSFVSRKQEKHAAQCELCRRSDSHGGHDDLAPTQPSSPPEKSGVTDDPSAGTPTSPKHDANGGDFERSGLAPKLLGNVSAESLQPSSSAPDCPYRVILSVGGMTCASCSNTITRMVQQVDGVMDVAVNLLGNSASVTIEHRHLLDSVLETIDDCGFDAEVLTVEPVVAKSSQNSYPTSGQRSLALRVHGLFCKHCPERISSALDSFVKSGQLTIDPGFSDTNPIIRLTYTPDPPLFTIRNICAAISSCEPPNGYSQYSVSVHQPATLEDRARVMQQREKRHLWHRLVFAFLAAIPTFVIGIVYMSLVPEENPTRRLFMRPLWTGNSSRAEWALFVLATPVMFYSAGLFHRRSIKEIRALWRPGSKTPVWKRFLRFGSMNLLVSTGVSVAYFSSIVLLALAASQERSPTGDGDTTTYFDSVVLLTMFLLCGRYMEAYSKGRTADAITALGKLRPSEALLLTPAAVTPDGPSLVALATADLEKDLEKGDVDAEQLAAKPGMKLQKVDVAMLEVGDVVRVVHGATPPADGTIVSAAADGGAFDESSLTGESRLIKKAEGDEIFLGTINRGGIVDVRLDAIGGETMLDRVVQVVREGQTRRAPIERIADLVTAYFVPVVTLLAVLTWVIWLSLGLTGSLPQDYLDIEIGGWVIWSLEFAIAVFVVACPCGIGLAAPTALLVGSGLAAKHGILARGGGEAFQETAQLDVIVFDKTGTLTEGGDPKVTNSVILPLEKRWTREDILGITAEIESASSHPLAIALQSFCEGQELSRVQGSRFEETPGRGIKGTFEGVPCTAVIGNEQWIEENSANLAGHICEQLEAWKSQGKSVVLLALRDDSGENADLTAFEVAAAFAISDPVRSEAKAVIDRLQQLGLGTWMISGDNIVTARAVARIVGIPETNVIAGVLPHEKADKIRWLQQVGIKRPPSRFSQLFGKRRLNERCIVGMVGDGINDAPALATADVGIAIGSGSDVAISSAAFILVSSNLRSILVLSELSRKVLNRVKFNFFWAGVYNIAALPIAAGVVYPVGHARLAPVWASLAMALSSVSVVCSSLLLKLYKPKLK